MCSSDLSLRAELGRYFRADQPTTANDYDLHDEPFRVAFDWSRRFRAFYRWASTVVSLFPADMAWAYCDYEPYGS